MSDALGSAFIEILPDLSEFLGQLQSGVEDAARQAGVSGEKALQSSFRDLDLTDDNLFADLVEDAKDSGQEAGGAITKALEGALDDIDARSGAFDELVKAAEDAGEDGGDRLRRALEEAVADVDLDSLERAFEPIGDSARAEARDAATAIGNLADFISDRLSKARVGDLGIGEAVSADVSEAEAAAERAARSIPDRFGAAGRGAASAFGSGIGGIGDSISGLFEGTLNEALAEQVTAAIEVVKTGFKAISVDAISAAADLGEAANVIGLVFGFDSANNKAVTGFAQSAARNLGLATSESLAFAGSLGGQLKNLGFSADETTRYSQSLQTLGADLASAFNAEVPDTISAIQAALRGENEQIERYNVFLTAAAVEQEALNSGLVANKSEINAATKAQATLNLIMRQSTDVTGDFAKTASSLPNLLRTLGGTFKNVQAQAGDPALKVLTPIVQSLVSRLEEAGPEIEAFGEGFAEFIERAGEPFLGLIDSIIDALPSFGSAFGAAGSGVGGLLNTVSGLIPVFTAITDVFSALPPEVLATVTQMVALRAAFGKAGPSAGAFAGAAGLMIGPLSQVLPLLSNLSGILEAIPASALQAGVGAAGVANAFRNIGGAATAGFEAASKAAAESGKQLGGFAKAQGSVGKALSSPKFLGAAAAATVAIQLYGSTMREAAEEGQEFASSVEEEFSRSLGKGEHTVSEAVDSIQGKIDSLNNQKSGGLKGFTIDRDFNESIKASVEDLEVFEQKLLDQQAVFAELGDEFRLTEEELVGLAQTFDVDLTPGAAGFEDAMRDALVTAKAGAEESQRALEGLEKIVDDIRTGAPATGQALIEAIAVDPAAALVQANALAEVINIPADKLRDAFKGAAEAVDGFVDTAASTLPTAGDAIKDALGAAVSDEGELSLSAFNENLRERAATLAAFNEDIATIANTNKDLAAELAAQGPEVTGALVESLAAAGPKMIEETAANIDGIQTENDRLIAFYRDTLGPAIAEGFLESIDGLLPAMEQGIEEQANSLEVLTAKAVVAATERAEDEARKASVVGAAMIAAAEKGVKENQGLLDRSVENSIEGALAQGRLKATDAKSIGRFVADGFAQGIEAGAERARSAARRLGDAAFTQLRVTGGVFSPSRVAMEIGGFIGDGLAIGITDTTGDVTGAAEQIARDASRHLADGFTLDEVLEGVGGIAEKIPSTLAGLEVQGPDLGDALVMAIANSEDMAVAEARRLAAQVNEALAAEASFGVTGRAQTGGGGGGTVAPVAGTVASGGVVQNNTFHIVSQTGDPDGIARRVAARIGNRLG